MKQNICLFCFFIICQTSFGWSQIPIYDYLVPKENITYRYNCFFVKEKDTVREIVEYKFVSISMPSGSNQSINIAREVDIKTHQPYTQAQLANKKIYYLENKITNEAYGSNHFLFSALLPIHGELALAPYFFSDEVNKLTAENFINTIPAFVQSNDTIQLVDGTRTTLLYGFTFENIEVPTSPGKIPCLKIEQEDRWPKNTYHGQVWVSLQYGIVKWIRTTGRTETLLFN